MVRWTQPLQEMTAGHDAWGRAAQRVLYLAAARDLAIDQETLLVSDVRDLQALALRLQARDRAERRWRSRF